MGKLPISDGECPKMELPIRLEEKAIIFVSSLTGAVTAKWMVKQEMGNIGGNEDFGKVAAHAIEVQILDILKAQRMLHVDYTIGEVFRVCLFIS